MDTGPAPWPPAGTRLVAASAVPDGGAVCVEITRGEARHALLVCRSGDRIVAYLNRCPHARFPLERLDGSVLVQSGRYIVCAAHGASFDLLTGAAAGGPGRGEGLTPAPVRVIADDVVIAAG